MSNLSIPSIESSKIVEVRSIYMKHKENILLDISNLEFEQGNIVSVVGPNGAGKSLFVDCLLGLVTPHRSAVKLFGKSVDEAMNSSSTLRRIGVQMARVRLNNNFKSGEIRKLYELSYGSIDERFSEMFAITELDETNYEHLSMGQRQRLNIYMALAHRPDLIVLDEPTMALDARYRDVFFDSIEIIRQEKKETLIICISHMPVDVERSDKCLWLSQGKTKAYDHTKKVIRDAVGAYTAQLEFSSATARNASLEILSSFKKLKKIETEGKTKLVLFANDDFKSELVEMADKFDLIGFSHSQSGAREFLEHTSKSI